MAYASLLKTLLEKTQVKLKDVSQALHYDPSYISKWINGHHLPSLEQSCKVNDFLANHLSQVIYNRGIQEDFRGLLPLNIDLGSRVILKKVLFNELNTAYFESYQDMNDLKILPQEKEKVFLGAHSIKNLLFGLFSLPLGSKKVAVYSSLNASYISRLSPYVKELLIFSTKTPVELHFILDKPDYFFDTTSAHEIFKTLAEMCYYDLHIYKKRTSLKFMSEFIYVRDHFVLFSIWIPRETPLSAVLYKMKKYWKKWKTTWPTST